MKYLRGALALATVVALAACGQAPTPVEPAAPSIVGKTFVPLGLEFEPQGVSLIMIDVDSLAVADLSEVQPGVYASAAAPVNADGTFELVLPTPEELPAGIMVPAADFVRLQEIVGPCLLTATVPSAKVTQFTIYGGLTISPGVFLLSVAGAAPALAASMPLDISGDPPTSGFSYVSWVYADAAVSINGPAAGCDVGFAPLFVGLELEEGWNQIALTFEIDPVTITPTSLTLAASAFEEVFFSPIPGGFGPSSLTF